jgi:hypothetical protein
MTGVFLEDLTIEANQILKILTTNLPKKIDGKTAILELKRIDYNWKQMEWIGWYLEHLLFTTIIDSFQGTGGPTFGNTAFDYKKKYVWDFKAHPILTPQGTRNDTMILNDKEAIDLCIEKSGGIGFIVVYGYAMFDQTGEFKVWHDTLKGGHSDYEKERIKRGAPSRKRKSAFEIDHIEALFFNNSEELNRGVSDRWITFFQEGMRNADGSPRRPKYAIKTSKIPDYIRPIDSVRME